MSPLRLLRRSIVNRPNLKQPLKSLKHKALRLMSLLLGPDLAPQIKILGYHTVGQGKNDLSITPKQFEDQLDWLLKNNFQNPFKKIIRKGTLIIIRGRGYIENLYGGGG